MYPASWAPNVFAETIFDEYPFLLPNLVFAAWLEPVSRILDNSTMILDSCRHPAFVPCEDRSSCGNHPVCLSFWTLSLHRASAEKLSVTVKASLPLLLRSTGSFSRAWMRSSNILVQLNFQQQFVRVGG